MKERPTNQPSSKLEPLSFVFFESPFSSVSTVTVYNGLPIYGSIVQGQQAAGGVYISKDQIRKDAMQFWFGSHLLGVRAGVLSWNF
jgi:hypothetical protein